MLLQGLLHLISSLKRRNGRSVSYQAKSQKVVGSYLLLFAFLSFIDLDRDIIHSNSLSSEGHCCCFITIPRKPQVPRPFTQRKCSLSRDSGFGKRYCWTKGRGFSRFTCAKQTGWLAGFTIHIPPF